MGHSEAEDFVSYHDAARGAVLGALAGDAAGATLEFLGRKPSQEEVRNAMCMVGGGYWRTAPGQITDDGELTLALAHALIGTRIYDLNRAAHFYRKWFLSRPFDIGITTRNALQSGDLDSSALGETIKRNAQRSNVQSKANGSLMRASVLGIWSSTVDLPEAIEAARLDAQLTHPNPSCQWAGVAYVVAIRHLLLQNGDAPGAFETARQALQAVDASEVAGWLQEAEQGDLPAFHPQAGFVRIAFTHAFYHLRKGSLYATAIAETLCGGGDTDTNACIVGGLMGALHGASAIPERMRSSISACDTSLGAHSRPEWLTTRHIDSLIIQLAGDSAPA